MQIKLEQTMNHDWCCCCCCWAGGPSFSGSPQTRTWSSSYVVILLYFVELHDHRNPTGRKRQPQSEDRGQGQTRNWINQLVSMHDLYNNRSIPFRAESIRGNKTKWPSKTTTTTAERRHDFFFSLLPVWRLTFTRLPIIWRLASQDKIMIVWTAAR